MNSDCHTNRLVNEQGKTAPLLVVKAGRDAASVNQSIDRFMASARAKNVPVEYLVQGEGRDGFDLRDNSGRSRAIIASTLSSFKAHLLANTPAPHYMNISWLPR